MKSKLLFLFALLVVGATACASCAKKDQVVENNTPTTTNVCTGDGGSCPVPSPKDADAPANVPDTISQENWQFTLTGPGWAPMSANSPDIKVAMKNDDLEMLVFLVKEPTNATYAEYVLGTIRAIRSQHVNITSASQVVVNGNKFVLVTVKGGSQSLYAWITTKDGFGYAFTCGGTTNVDAGAAPCEAIASTLQIK